MIFGKLRWQLLLASAAAGTIFISATLASSQGSDNRSQRYAIHAITFTGATSLSARQLLGAAKLRKGFLVTDDDLSKSASLLSTAYLRKGFVRARVTTSKRNVGTFSHDRHPRVNVVFDIQEGPQFLIRVLEVIGTRVTDDKVVSRSIGMRPWDPYDPKAIDTAIKRLNRVGTLDVVKKEDVEVRFDDAEHRVDLRFHLREKL